MGALAAGSQAPASVSAYSLSFSSSATSGRGPDLSPLTRRFSPGGRSPQTLTSRPLGVGSPSLSSLGAPCRDPVLAPHLPAEWGLVLPRLSWRGLQTPPHPRLAARSAGSSSPRALEFDSGPAWRSPCPRVFPSPPFAAVTGNGAQIFGTPGVRKGRERGPRGPACFVVMMEPLQPGGGARPS